MTSRRDFLKGVLATGAGILVSACAGGPQPAPTAAPAPAAPKPAGAAPNPTAAAPAAPQKQYGGIAKSFIATNLQIKIDPQSSSSIGDLPVTAPTYSGILRFDPYDPKKVVGDLAEKWERVDGGKAVRFYFRKGVTWHDGSAFSADDVVFSVQRMLDPKFASPRGGALLRSAVSEARKVDDLTVDLMIKQPPRPYDDMILASPFIRVVSKKWMEGGGDPTKQVMGTGPFKLKSLSDNLIELTRNDKYFIQGRPYLDGVVHERDTNVGTQLAGLRTGKYTMGSTLGRFELRDMEALKKDVPDIQIHEGPNTLHRILFMNSTRAPFTDPKVRRAIFLGIDRQDFQVRSGMQGVVALLDPRLFGKFALDVAQAPGYRQPKDQDIAEAKRLIAESNAADVAIEVLADNPANEKGIQVLAEQLRGIGFKNVTARLDAGSAVNVTASQMKHSMFLQGPGPALADPTVVIETFYLPGAVRNFTGMDDPKIKELHQTTFATDEAARLTAVQNFQKYILEGTTPWVPLTWDNKLQPLSAKVRDYIPGPTAFDNYEYDAVWLAK